MRVPQAIRDRLAEVPPRTRQWALLGGLGLGGVGVLWAIFASTQDPKSPVAKQRRPEEASKVTNVGVMPGGEQVKPLDQWIGIAGRKVDRLEREKEEREKRDKETEAFKSQVLKRFAELEEKAKQPNTAGVPADHPPSPAGVHPSTYPPVAALPPAPGLPGQPPAPASGSAPGAASPAAAAPEAARPQLVRVSLADPTKKPAVAGTAPTQQQKTEKSDGSKGNVDTYLPVSFTRGVMLGGLDAPTGGQAQSNPHPVLIRLDDNAVLPNRFRSNVRECFVIAAGYGDIASERAYMRTESLSCVRNDGSTLEVKIQGSVFGEDGLVGVRGRLVTKQGQMLANALLAGLLSGFGQGLSNYQTTVTQSTFGTISTTEGNQAFKQGIGSGVGKAFDRLATYYIKLAESTFPIIEVGAGRSVDVVITKGVRIDGGDPLKAEASPTSGDAAERDRLVYTRTNDDY